MTASFAVPIAAILSGLGTGEREAAEAGRWLEELIDDARRGWPVPEFNRAEIVERLRGAYGRRDGNETRIALAALDRVEREVFGGACVPGADIRTRFHPTSLSIWDRELNRFWCHDCQSWAAFDGHTDLLGPMWCPCGANLVP